jgi:transformation/transcription domain-associated protein
LSVVIGANLLLNNMEPVPFRLTPNLQRFITSAGVDGVFCGSLVAAASCLSEPEYKLDRYLSLLMRDELTVWMTLPQVTLSEQDLHARVKDNVAIITGHVEELACRKQRERVNFS